MTKRNYNCALLAVSGCLFAPLLFGLALGFSGPAIDTMEDNVKQDKIVMHINPASNLYVFKNSGEASLFSSIVTIGAMIGALAGGYLTEKFGRKTTLMGLSPLFALSWLWIAIANTNIQLQIARILNGFGVGVASFVAPTYIGEVSPTHIRGTLGTINQVSLTIGIMLSYLLGVLFRTNANTLGVEDDFFCNWRILCYIFIIPSVLLGVCMFFSPETPFWLASKGKQTEAHESLRKLRGGQPSAVEVLEIDTLLASKQHEKDMASFKDLKECKSQLFVGIMLQVLQQFSGINVVMFYQTTIYQDAGVENSNTYAFGVMLCQVLVTILAAGLMDKAGRKVLFATGCIGMTASAFAMGGFFVHTEPAWLGIVSMYFYIAFFAIGVGAIPWLIMAEIFPSRVRGLASSIATVFNWVIGFILTKFLDSAVNATSYTAVFFFFGCICIIATIFTFVFVPETKGKTFEEVQMFFNAKEKGKKAGTVGA